MADRRLQIFQAVARALSFTRAAEVLNMTQPAVTFQIKQLEEQFNVRLFDRGRSGVTLTPAGELAQEYAERILALTSELESRLTEMGGPMQGTFPLGASPSIAESMLPGILEEFRMLYPRVRARLTVASAETVCARVAEGVLDFGLVENPTPLSGMESENCRADLFLIFCKEKYRSRIISTFSAFAREKLREVPR